MHSNDLSGEGWHKLKVITKFFVNLFLFSDLQNSRKELSLISHGKCYIAAKKFIFVFLLIVFNL